jgi:hypothetical protein
VEKEIKLSALVHGHIKSCGCSRYNPRGNGVPFRLGNRYGMLVVVEIFHHPGKGGRIAKFKCDCGQEKIAFVNNVQRGSTQSCGCLRRTARRLTEGEAQLRYYYNRTKKGAERRGYCFELTKEQVNDIITRPCSYCGVFPVLKQQRTYFGGIKISGIDRKDNTLGYVDGNCVPCCGTCNMAKSEMTFEEFKVWVSRVDANINGGKN